MNTLSKAIVLLVALSLLTPVIASAKRGNNSNTNNRKETVSVLTVEQEDTLLWMREEEKLARDVYLTLYDTWNVAVFKNIANSEQKHMDALLKKVNTFKLTDPVIPGIGEFSDENLQDLYPILVESGSGSYAAALRVGATIEDLDIADLIEAIEALENTDNLALKTTYNNLLEGSKNHLRSFIGYLQLQGETYTPQYISQELFDAIINVY